MTLGGFACTMKGPAGASSAWQPCLGPGQGSQGREKAAAAQSGQAKWIQPTSKCHGPWLQARVPQPIAAEPDWQGGSPANGHVYSSKHY